MQRLEVSGAVRPLPWSLGVKGLINSSVNLSFKLNLLYILPPLHYSRQWATDPSLSSLHEQTQTHHTR